MGYSKSIAPYGILLNNKGQVAIVRNNNCCQRQMVDLALSVESGIWNICIRKKERPEIHAFGRNEI